MLGIRLHRTVVSTQSSASCPSPRHADTVAPAADDAIPLRRRPMTTVLDREGLKCTPRLNTADALRVRTHKLECTRCSVECLRTFPSTASSTHASETWCKSPVAGGETPLLSVRPNTERADMLMHHAVLRTLCAPSHSHTTMLPLLVRSVR